MDAYVIDISSVVGPILAIGMIAGGMIAKGAGNLIPELANLASVLIVIGGTGGALMVAYPLKDFIGAFKALGIYLGDAKASASDIKNEILELAQVARKESILALEKRTDSISYPPLRAAIRMAVDGTDPNIIRDTLETEASYHHQEADVAVKFWEDFGAIAPTVGILGAVIGLMKVMTVLDQPEQIGPGIAVAFIATIYGVGFANIFGIPIGKKLKRKAILDGYLREMVAIGVEGILTGLNPKIIESKLLVFTDEDHSGE